MSKGTAHARKRKVHRADQPRPTPDGAIYAGLTLIGVFITLLAVPLTGGDHWREVALGYVIAMAWLTNLYAYRAYRGAHLSHWQAALARLPLRCAGYGTRGGKPIEAAKGHDNARRALIGSVIVSVLVIAVVAALLFGGLL